MEEIDLNAEISEIMRNNAQNFLRLHFERCSLNISKNSAFWEADKIPKNITGPAASFFNDPPLVINYSVNNSRPKSISRADPNKNLFVFDPNIVVEESSRPLDEILQQSAPLASIMKSADVHAFKDTRLQYATPSYQYVSFTISFENLMYSFQTVEPFYVSIFLFDDTTFEPVSEIYNYPCNNDTCFLNTIPSPNPVFNVPVDKINSVKIIVCLTRLLHKDGGEDFDNFYTNQSSTHVDKLREICININHKNIFSIFAFTDVPIPQMISGNIIELTKFIKTSTVSRTYLENYFKYPPQEFTTVPIGVKLKISRIPFQPNLVYPFESYVNYITVNLENSFFTFPPGMRGRNLYCKVQIVHNGAVFSEYKSFCQYHVENPQFFDTFRLQLPPDLNTESELVFRFYHAVVKGEFKDKSQDSGVSSIKLINQGLFLGDGRHTVGISFDGTPAKPTESNCFNFSTTLNSIVYTNSKTCELLYNGNYNEIVLPGLNEILPVLYVIADYLLANIKDGKKGSFKMLLKLLKLFPKERSANQLLYYVRNLALRGVTDFSPMFMKTWIKYTEHSFSTKRSDLHYAWLLLEILTKSLLMEKPHTRLLIELFGKLTSYFPFFRDGQQNVGLDLNKYISLFERDIFEFVDRNAVVIIVSNHLSQFDLSQLYDASLFKNFFQNFFTPRTFCIFCLPLSDGDTLLNQIILPHLRQLDNFTFILEDVFKHIFSLLLTFEPEEQFILTTGMVPLLEIIGNMGNATRHRIIYSLTVGIFIAYNVEISDFNDKVAAFAELILRCSLNTETEIDDEDGEDSHQKVWRSRQGSIFTLPSDIVWDALSFCSQAICIKWCGQFSNMRVFNSILVRFLDVIIALPLQGHFFKLLNKFALEHFDELFSPVSNLKHLVRAIITSQNKKGIQFLASLYMLEHTRLGDNKILDALIARSLYLCPPFGNQNENFDGTPFSDLVKRLCECYSVLHKSKIKRERVESREQIAKIVSCSPDARVKALLDLSEELIACELPYESTIAVLHAMAIVAEYSHANFDRVYPLLAQIAPSIIDERQHILKVNMRGIAKAKEFCAYGFVRLAELALQTCARVPRLHLKLTHALIPICMDNGMYKQLSYILKQSAKDTIIETPMYQTKISDFFYIKTDKLEAVVHLTNPQLCEAALAIIREVYGIHKNSFVFIRALKKETPDTFYYSDTLTDKIIIKTVRRMPTFRMGTAVKAVERMELPLNEAISNNLKMRAAEINDIVANKEFIKLEKILKEVLLSEPRKSLGIEKVFDKAVANSVIEHGIWALDNTDSIEIQMTYEAVLRNAGIEI